MAESLNPANTSHYAMRSCCPNKSLPIRRSSASLQTSLAIRVSATMPSQKSGAATVIPPRKNAKPWKAITAGGVVRNEALRASKYLSRALWLRWSCYYRRSCAETKMHCEELLGQRLMARDFDPQIAESQVRVAVQDGYTALSVPFTKVAE